VTGPAAGEVAYGVDVGGTKILGVALGANGEVLAQHRVATPHQAAATAARGQPGGAARPGAGGHPGEAVADAVVGLLVQLHGDLGADDALATAPIGVGIAGLVDTAGVLRFSPNLAAATGADVARLVAARLGTHPGGAAPAHNDAKCAAFAELVLGAARGMRDGLVITLGTGIGGAQIVHGRVRAGAHGFGGEFGHIVVDPNGPPCPCGNRGCWERYASGGGLARLARESAFAGTLREPVRLAGGDPEHVTGEHVAAAAAAGDPDALRVMAELGWWVGLGLANLVAAFDPEWIVLGGGLGHAGEMLLGPARGALAALVEGGGARGTVPVVEAGLGEQAGAVGAALAARHGSLDLS